MNEGRKQHTKEKLKYTQPMVHNPKNKPAPERFAMSAPVRHRLKVESHIGPTKGRFEGHQPHGYATEGDIVSCITGTGQVVSTIRTENIGK